MKFEPHNPKRMTFGDLSHLTVFTFNDKPYIIVNDDYVNLTTGEVNKVWGSRNCEVSKIIGRIVP